jgi:hypothetical protein
MSLLKVWLWTLCLLSVWWPGSGVVQCRAFQPVYATISVFLYRWHTKDTRCDLEVCQVHNKQTTYPHYEIQWQMYGAEGYTHGDTGKAMTLYYTRLNDRSLMVQHIHWQTCITSEYNNLTTHLWEFNEDLYDDFSIVVIFRLFLVVNDYPFHCTIPVEIKLTLINSVQVCMRTYSL